MTDFFRSDYSQLWLTLQASEQLGLLDNSYLEDYNGAPGQISLWHLQSHTRVAVLMTEVPEATPAIPFDVFQGYVDLSELLDGAYYLQLRCRDVVGNYRIVGDVAQPRGDEQRLNIYFRLLSTPLPPGPPVTIGALRLQGGHAIDARASAWLALRCPAPSTVRSLDSAVGSNEVPVCLAPLPSKMLVSAARPEPLICRQVAQATKLEAAASAALVLG